MYKSDCKILSYGRFKILAQACPKRGDGIDPEYCVSSLYISVAIKVRFLKFDTFNRYKNNISKLVFYLSGGKEGYIESSTSNKMFMEKCMTLLYKY